MVASSEESLEDKLRNNKRYKFFIIHIAQVDGLEPRSDKLRSLAYAVSVGLQLKMSI